MAGAEGPRWSLPEVRGLLSSAERGLQLCKAWVPSASWKKLRGPFLKTQASMQQAAAAAAPGQEFVLAPPRPGDGLSGAPSVQAIGCCASCGRPSTQLRKCAACKAVAYCSLECQAKHWKAAGGHKQECGRLAAASR